MFSLALRAGAAAAFPPASHRFARYTTSDAARHSVNRHLEIPSRLRVSSREASLACNVGHHSSEALRLDVSAVSSHLRVSSRESGTSLRSLATSGSARQSTDRLRQPAQLVRHITSPSSPPAQLPVRSVADCLAFPFVQGVSV